MHLKYFQMTQQAASFASVMPSNKTRLKVLSEIEYNTQLKYFFQLLPSKHFKAFNPNYSNDIGMQKKASRALLWVHRQKGKGNLQ